MNRFYPWAHPFRSLSVLGRTHFRLLMDHCQSWSHSTWISCRHLTLLSLSILIFIHLQVPICSWIINRLFKWLVDTSLGYFHKTTFLVTKRIGVFRLLVMEITRQQVSDRCSGVNSYNYSIWLIIIIFCCLGLKYFVWVSSRIV